MQVKVIYTGTHKKVHCNGKIFVRGVPTIMNLPEEKNIPANFEEYKAEKKEEIKEDIKEEKKKKVKKPKNNC